jgi:hypothetical protein
MPLLTREQILAAERPAGFRDLADVIADLRSGRLPRTPALDRIAAAFERVLAGELAASDLDAALRLRASQGRRKRTAAALFTEANEGVCRFVQRHLEADPKRRGAPARAVAAAAERFGLDVRTVERAWKRTLPAREAEALSRRLVQETTLGAAVIRRHIRPEEIAGALGALQWSEVVSIARVRARRETRK